MLLSLSIRDFVLVDRLDLRFDTGFTVLSGETGAGKSVLIDALGLLLGDRADAGWVRHGAGRAELAAQFDIAGQDSVVQLLEDYALEGDEGLCLLRRTIDSSGRSRAFINGQPATAAQLKEIGEYLVDIHGQHAHQSLLRSEAQRTLLDAYGGQGSAVTAVRGAFQQWRQLKDRLDRAVLHADEHSAERERLLWQIDEVAALELLPDEWMALQTEHARLAHAAALIEGCEAGLSALSEGEVSCQSMLASTQAQLGALVDYDPELQETIDLLASVEAQLSETVYSLRHYSRRLELDPERLGEVERRMDTLYRISRKYRCEVEKLPELLEQWRGRLNELGVNEDVEALTAAVAEAEQTYRALAVELSAARASAASRLGEVVSQEMQTMAMAGSRFEIALIALEQPAAYGLEQVEFRVAPHAQAPARSLAKVASGGELSRISLALQVVTSQLASVPTLIFDEVDVGIGGRVAEIVGQLLKRLGQRHQVLCVTHLPQVAACGDRQFQVSKHQSENGIYSRIEALDDRGRVEEIARMLGGVELTDLTRQHAAEMLGIVLA